MQTGPRFIVSSNSLEKLEPATPDIIGECHYHCATEASSGNGAISLKTDRGGKIKRTYHTRVVQKFHYTHYFATIAASQSLQHL